MLRVVTKVMVTFTLMFLAYGLFVLTTTGHTHPRPASIRPALQQAARQPEVDTRTKPPTNIKKKDGSDNIKSSEKFKTKTESRKTTSKKHESALRSPGNTNRKYLIYLCDKKRWCGGLGDRERGMVATYLLARVTGRQFGINMTYPCDIKYFLVPNKINWIIKITDIRGLSTRIVDWMDSHKHDVNLTSDFNKMFPEDVVFLKTNIDFVRQIYNSKIYSSHVPESYHSLSPSQLFRKVWNELMTFSVHFNEHMEIIASNIPETGNLICAHVRMRRNPTIPNDGDAINHVDSVKKLWQFLSKYEKNASRIFVATDSLEVRQSARERFKGKEMDTDGLIMHVDRQGKWGEACLGLEMALVDQMMLTRCKVLVCSRSNFSQRAAQMATVEQDVFLFNNGTIKKV